MSDFQKIEKSFDFDVKRFYLPYEFSVKCKSCGQDLKINLAQDPYYLSYPSLNNENQYWVYCDDCDEDVDLRITLKMEIKIEEKS